MIRRRLLVAAIAMLLTIAACTTRQLTPANTQETAAVVTPTAAPGATQVQSDSTPVQQPTIENQSQGESSTAGQAQPERVTGSFSFTNEIILNYYVQHAASLTDLYGFVIRDKEWKIPVESQNLGFLDIDEEEKTGTFAIQLPLEPRGMLVDVNPDGRQETGVQIFAAEYFPNLTGGPYAEGDDSAHGWPTYLASVRTDRENQDEIIGGMLIIWSPDAEQFFPSGFGPDGLLFTEDDPVMPVPQGYSAIDLDQSPFQIIREEEVTLTLYEPDDVAIKDFSALSYTEAFEQMFAIARKEYAFNDVEGKAPDWDALYEALAPRVAAAEQEKSPEAFFLALREFTLAFQDGHVGLNGGPTGQETISRSIAGGYGFAVRELDDGRVLVVHVVSGGPADEAGMLPGAEITEFNGLPVSEAIAAVDPPNAPHSMATRLRSEQARFLVRAPLGETASVTFTNPEGDTHTVDLEAVREQESMFVTSPYRNIDPTGLPVEYIVASNGLGYVRLYSNYDDLNLIIRLFQRALDKFEENEVETLIIDLRANSGGANLGLAGFLTDEEIVLGQLEYYSDVTGKFEAIRPPDRVEPNEKQYRFRKMFLLVDEACASACELEAYGFSQVPGMVVVGHTPTAGVEAEVARGQFKLPEDMTLQIPTGRFVLPDGSIFLEGKGVEPDERVPVNEDTVLNQQDPVLQHVIRLANQ